MQHDYWRLQLPCRFRGHAFRRSLPYVISADMPKTIVSLLPYCSLVSSVVTGHTGAPAHTRVGKLSAASRGPQNTSKVTHGSGHGGHNHNLGTDVRARAQTRGPTGASPRAKGKDLGHPLSRHL